MPLTIILLVSGLFLVGMFILAACSDSTQEPEVDPTLQTTLRPTFTSVPAGTLPAETTEEPVTPTATPSPPPSGPVEMKSPGYAMQAFLWWRPEVAQRDLELIRDAGFGWVKQVFAWREIEGTGKGQYDWSVSDRIVEQAESVGLHVIARLDSDPTWASGQAYPNTDNIIMTPPEDYQDFADFCYALASRYKGRIAAYQLWNEPNLSREWGGMAPDPEGYVDLLKEGYEAIKRADPNAIVISAGLAPTTRWDHVAMPDTEYLQRMYAAGAAPYFDALGAHGAGYRAPPELDPGEAANDPSYYNNGDSNCPGPLCRIYCFRHVEDLREIMVNHGDTDKQVVVLEFGWTIDSRPDSPYGWHAVSEEQQADYFVRAYQYAKEHWQPWIGVMSLIYMPDADWTEDDEQYWWSIAVPNYPQFLPRKAYRDLAPMEK
ncbi:MAG: cellulase family glycosylhydrolase [Anaerolineae bacterium]|nr:cellulase family glycosylhydrolase [Anaerolineae bacterium]